MKTEIISQLHSSFESAVNETDGVEYWFARDLQLLLGYNEWRNFLKVIDKAKTACETAKQKVLDHFVDVNKMVDVVLSSPLSPPLYLFTTKGFLNNISG